jgi:hypothetical protein
VAGADASMGVGAAAAVGRRRRAYLIAGASTNRYVTYEQAPVRLARITSVSGKPLYPGNTRPTRPMIAYIGTFQRNTL